MNKLALAFCIAVTLAFIGGCRAEQEEAARRKGRAKPIVIGLMPEHNLFRQLARYEPLARYLSGKLRREVNLKVLPRYGNIIDNFVSTGLDGAGSFVEASDRDYAPISTPTSGRRDSTWLPTTMSMTE
jgi:ABC-type phosphate/phosphonate transport system substrate-binding protein